MNIAILGAGNVGGALGRRWASVGHRVRFGVPDIRKPAVVALVREIGSSTTAGGNREAASFGEVVVLVTPWHAAEAALQGSGDLTGKVLVDCTNPLKKDFSGLMIGYDTSGGEQVAEWSRGTRVVKCFNTAAASSMARPDYGELRLTMILCGDDAAAKRVVATLAEQFGFEPADAGPLRTARLLEPLAMLWIHLSYVQGWGKDFGFCIARR